MAEAISSDDTDGAAPAKRPLRRKLLAGIGGAVLLAGVGYSAWDVLEGRHHIETDNAYVGAETAQVTPMVVGLVAAVLVSDAQAVRRGDVLARIDDSDTRIALAGAQAALLKAERQFGQVDATSGALSADVAARNDGIDGARAQLAAAQAASQRAQVDLARRKALAPDGAVSGEELTAAINAYAAAQGNLDAARATLRSAMAARGAAQGMLAANAALIRGTTVTTNPDVLAAKARVDQARLDLARTVIRAPVDGIVTGRAVQVGQRVTPGAAIMRVVPIRELYVDANFKEGQLADVRPGQKVTITSDLYGAAVVYHGTVVGFSGGTGAAFALIPAQNATGN